MTPICCMSSYCIQITRYLMTFVDTSEARLRLYRLRQKGDVECHPRYLISAAILWAFPAKGVIYTKPRLGEEKLPRVGKMVLRLAAGTPNQEARVAAYCELAVVGSHRPVAPESFGPPSARVG